MCGEICQKMKFTPPIELGLGEYLLLGQKIVWLYIYRPTIMVIIFLDFLMFYQIFLSPQVKQIVIISNRHGIYELPHELPNNLKLGS